MDYNLYVAFMGETQQNILLIAFSSERKPT